MEALALARKWCAGELARFLLSATNEIQSSRTRCLLVAELVQHSTPRNPLVACTGVPPRVFCYFDVRCPLDFWVRYFPSCTPNRLSFVVKRPLSERYYSCCKSPPNAPRESALATLEIRPTASQVRPSPFKTHSSNATLSKSVRMSQG